MSKLWELAKLVEIRQQLRRDGKRVVFTNGCFDLIHPGHISYLRAARALGECLIVALNSDRSIQELKGPQRPILTETERAAVLAALEMVDYVVIFDDVSPQATIAQLLPDILVKGGDWTVDNIIGRAEVEQAGGQVISLPYIAGSSSTDIIGRILERYGQAESLRETAGA